MKRAPGPDLVLYGGEIATVAGKESATPERVEAIGIRDGRIVCTGSTSEVRELATPDATSIDLGGRTVIPGIIDSHNHFVRAGKRWTVDTHWERVTSLTDALDRVRDAASGAGKWVSVLGGWHPDQFVERRAPARADLDAAAPTSPVYVQYAYASGILNSAAIRAVEGEVAQAPEAVRAGFDRDASGAFTGRVAAGAALTWMSTRLGFPDLETQIAGTAELSRELSGLGVTGLSDGGGLRSGPDSYEAVFEAWRRRQLTVRARLTVHASGAGLESAEFENYRKYTHPRFGDGMLQVLGAGEIMLYRSHDHVGAPADVSEDAFRELGEIYSALAEAGWTTQTHAHNRELISGLLSLWSGLPTADRLPALRWALVHADMVEHEDLATMRSLGIGVLVQGQFRHSGGHAIEKLGKKVASSPPLRALLDAGIPLGLGSDAFTAAPYNPFEHMHWFQTGLTLGGQRTLSGENLLSRAEALRGYTADAAWFSFEETSRGTLEPGKLADLAVLTDDYFTVPIDELPTLRSTLTLVGGEVMHADGDFAGLAASENSH